MSIINYKTIRLPEEIELSESICETLSCESIYNLLQIANDPELLCHRYFQYYLETIDKECFLVNPQSSPRYYRMFSEIVERLGFTDPVRFYIKSAPTVSAFAVPSMGNLPHAVVIHSSTLKIMNDDEIRLIIGHEIGHLTIPEVKYLSILNNYFFKIDENASLRNKVHLWRQLMELSADRFGYLAMPDLNVHISAGIKRKSGMSLEQLVDDYNIDYQRMLEKHHNIVKQFQAGYGIYEDVHPSWDFRVVALDLYRMSHWLEKDGYSDEVLNLKTKELLQGLYNVAESELDVVKARFHASAGLLIAGCDAGINQDELDHIYANISKYQIFPKQYFESIAKEDYVSIFEESVERLLQEYPDDIEFKKKLLHRFVQISLADHNIRPIEMDVILHYAQTLLGFSKQKAACIMLNSLNKHFMPNPEDIF